ncbi:hypothetical protein MHN80_23550 [Gordonia McavH-238-E]|uniref:hypothetical protein n=1 Tax=Gordonia sp. McavH-238-E TaxID=2917736 RepID=UPI001EF4D500|nr:hypothetical protein [Gordonia sp. McavH-238-E]MCG7635295.1 hypothetical protein [Gordonia sp. McavH-238-E]
MTLLSTRPGQRGTATDDTAPHDQIPDTVRIGGVLVMTAMRYEALKMAAADDTGGRWATRRAQRRLAAENRRRERAITRAVEQGGFDIESPDPGHRGTAKPGGGRTSIVVRMLEWRTTTAQVAGGFWPFSIGASSPLLGTPLGAHLQTGQDFGCDPLTWFLAGLITAPIAFVLALNGFGKSSLVRRLAEGNMAQGHTSLFLGDIKPDYADLTRANDGQVITGGYGHQQINPLAAGALGEVLDQLRERAAAMEADPQASRRGLDKLHEQITQVSADLRSRQVATVAGLVEINRGRAVEDYEDTLLGSALDILYTPVEDAGKGFTGSNPPILEDLYAVVKAGGPSLYEDAAVETPEAYVAATSNLLRSLRALVSGRLGRVLNGQTTEPINVNAPAVCVDVSRVPKGDKKLKAALLLVCWSDGFGAVEAAHVLADAGLGPRRTFQVIIDELWQVIGSGAGIVDRVDALVRLNRSDAVSLIMITHSVADLSAFESQADANKAIGFLEKARLKFIGPVGTEELDRLSTVTHFNRAERALVTSAASTPPPSESVLRKLRARMRAGDDASTTSADRPRPHGQGVFLLKSGEDDRPGTPFRLNFTPIEADGGVHNTSGRFTGVSTRSGDVA